MKQKTFYLLAALLLTGFSACKKESTITPQQDLSNPETPAASLRPSCGVRQPDLSYNPVILPVNFLNPTTLSNPYFPIACGKKYIYEGNVADGFEHIEEHRLSTTKTILGINCIEVEFKAFLNGILIEKATDWYAQHNYGTVWYFGEAVDNYNPDGSFKNHAGSWEAGVDGAKAGVVMRAHPRTGMHYREEYYFNHAEDEAKVIGTGLTVTIPLGTYTNCIKTQNFTALEPGVLEYKYYAPGVGLIKDIKVNDNSEVVLVRIE